jgi:hypothetical protein
MIDGLPNWRRGANFPAEPTLALVMAGKNGWIRYYLANWRWHKPWFKPIRKVWWASSGQILNPICWVPVQELFKLPCDYTDRAPNLYRTDAQRERELEAVGDQQRASAVSANAFDVIN